MKEIGFTGGRLLVLEEGYMNCSKASALEEWIQKVKIIVIIRQRARKSKRTKLKSKMFQDFRELRKDM